MFAVTAHDLCDLVDKVIVHRPYGPAADRRDVVVFDCTRGWLHLAAASNRTLAVARTAVTGSHWSAPVSYDDAYALRGWLESCEWVHVEHCVDGGYPSLRFSEGTANLAVPVRTDSLNLAWRALLRTASRPASYVRQPIGLSSAEMALWQDAGPEIEVWHAGGRAAFLITAGPDFVGAQWPLPGGGNGDALAGWSLRARQFLHEGMPYEVGAVYADARGMLWRIPAMPAPGEEAVAVSADPASVVMPLATVLRIGGRLLKLPV
ncbi:hypothetical protein [Streptomyces sp. NBC_01187]|uniref:hypothetical protein n=1 Tax=Streptomyces sp. NBC_01187 TaxID=2903766 RepID=UPI003865E322|nr:hypothetical protein OG220_11755 [Streptomyces sp. NBC_01187]